MSEIPQPKNRPTVLIIDDDKTFRLLAERTLSRAGYEVAQADNGGDGLKLAEELKPAVVLLDWVMPVMDGIEVCRRLRENPQLRHSQIVMVSARAEIGDKITELELGADDYLVKPCESRELLARIGNSLRIFKLNRQLAEKADLQALLRRASDRIRSSLDVEEILRCTAEEVLAVVRSSAVVIYRQDLETGRPACFTWAGTGKHKALPDFSPEVLKVVFPSAVLELAENVAVESIPDQAETVQFLEQIAGTGLRSWLAVPICVGEQGQIPVPAYGLIAQNYERERAWTEGDVFFLESLATQTGIALEHAQLYKQARKQAQREALLNRTLDRIRRSLELEEVFQATVDELRELLGADRCVIFELDDEGEYVLTRCESVVADVLSVKEVQIPIRTAPLAKKVMYNGERVCLEEVAAASNPELILRENDNRRTVDADLIKLLMPRSVLALPLLAQGKVAAGLAIHQCNRRRRWMPEEVELVTAIANQAGLAMENAQLFSEIQDRNRELEETVGKLEELARQREEFTAVLVHDIRSPLTVITGALEMVRNRATSLRLLDEDLKQLLDNGNTTVRNIVELVNEILDFSKAGSGALTLDLTPVLPIDIIQAAQRQVELLARQKGIDLHAAVQPGLPQLMADHQKLVRALVNLLTNAVKFTPRNGEILIQARFIEGRNFDQGKKFVIISVIDTGPGIPAQEVPYIFNPYYQARQRSRQLGTGLGLAIVQRILAAHGGNVSVQSTEGIGTSFSILMPVTG